MTESESTAVQRPAVPWWFSEFWGLASTWCHSMNYGEVVKAADEIDALLHRIAASGNTANEETK